MEGASGGYHGAKRVPKRGPGGRQDRVKVARVRFLFERRPGTAKESSKKRPKAFPEGTLILKIIGFTMVKRIFVISLLTFIFTPAGRQKRAARTPREAPEGSQRGPDDARRAPSGAQDACKKK